MSSSLNERSMPLPKRCCPIRCAETIGNDGIGEVSETEARSVVPRSSGQQRPRDRATNNQRATSHGQRHPSAVKRVPPVNESSVLRKRELSASSLNPGRPSPHQAANAPQREHPAARNQTDRQRRNLGPAFRPR